MQAQTTLTENSTIQYWTYHQSKKPTIVMIHGFTGNHEGFQYIEPLLKEYRLIIPDLPGFGASTITRDDWSIDSIAALLNDFVASLKLKEPPFIFGHSMGGLVVSSMLSQAPVGLYDPHAILLSPVPTPIRKNDARRPGAILGALQYKIGAHGGRAGKKLVTSRTISRALTSFIMTTTDKQLRTEIYHHHFKNLEYISSIEFYSKLYTDINRLGAISYKDALRRYKVLLITGDADTVTPLREERKLIDAITPEQVIVLEGVGHLTHYERAPEVARAVQTFLK